MLYTSCLSSHFLTVVENCETLVEILGEVPKMKRGDVVQRFQK